MESDATANIEPTTPKSKEFWKIPYDEILENPDALAARKGKILAENYLKKL